jgi:hypothetical protein
MSFGRILKYALVAFEIAIASLAVFYDIGTSTAAVSVTIMLIWIGVLIETGVLALKAPWSTQGVTGYGLLLIPVMLVNYVLRGPAPSWFPTESTLWILIPFLSFGVVSLLRGWTNGAQRRS